MGIAYGKRIWPLPAVAGAVIVMLASAFFLNHQTYGRKGTHLMIPTRDELKAAVPPMDVAVPARTETATFALG